MPRPRSADLLKTPLDADGLLLRIKTEFESIKVRTRDLVIPSVAPPARSQRSAAKLFENAFSKNHGRLHGHLKWFGINWAANQMATFNVCRYEATIAIPWEVEKSIYDDKWSWPSAPGEVLRQGETIRDCLTRLSNANRPLFDPSDCSEVVVDVLGHSGTVVECGTIDLINLLLPIAANAIRRTVWIPFPSGIALNSEWPQSQSSCAAVEVMLGLPSTKETQRHIQTLLKQARKS